MIRVWLFGQFKVEIDDQVFEGWGNNNYARMVFIWLVTHGRRCNRVIMVDELWPDTPTSTAESYLSKSIAQLRKRFTIRTTGHRSIYEFLDEVWIDAEECQRLVLKAEKVGRFSEEGIKYLEQAAYLLDRGPCLESEPWSWCHAIRVPIEEVARCCRSWLVQAYESRCLYLNAQAQRKHLDPEGTDEMNRRDLLKLVVPGIFIANPVDYVAGVTTLCKLLTENRLEDVVNLFPLYQIAITLEAQKSGPLQKQMYGLLAQLSLIQARVDMRQAKFTSAHHDLDTALNYAQEAGDANVLAITLLRKANTCFHAHDYQQALELFQRVTLIDTTPLLAGYAHIGLAKTYASICYEHDTQSVSQVALKHLDLAHKLFPDAPQHDPMYTYTSYDTYDLLVYGTVLPKIQLGQTKEAEKFLQEAMNVGKPIDPLTHVDYAYYKNLIEVRSGVINIDQLMLAASLAARSGSKLYLAKNKVTLLEMKKRWPNELKLKKLELPTAQV